MKQLTIAYLLLGTASYLAAHHATTGAYAIDYSIENVAPEDIFCNFQPIADDAGVEFFAGKMQYGEGCTIARQKKFTIVGSTPPTSGGAATVVLKSFTVGDAAMLRYFGSNEAVMSTAVPYHISIFNTTFVRNAVLVFQGSFSPD